MATAPKSQVHITAKSLDMRSISAPNTFSAYGSLSTMPMRMLRLRASPITFTPSVCPTPNCSVLTCHGHYDNYHSTFPARFTMESSSILDKAVKEDGSALAIGVGNHQPDTRFDTIRQSVFPIGERNHRTAGIRLYQSSLTAGVPIPFLGSVVEANAR